MNLSVLVGFLPWIVFGLVSDWSITAALSLALVMSTFTTGKQVRARSLKILDSATFALFAFLFVAVVVVRWAAIGPWMFVAVNGSLALIAWGSLAVGIPFAIQYAKEQVAPEYWDTPGFLRVNQWITVVWAANFLIQAGISVYRRLHGSGIILELAWVPLTAFSILFTIRFPDWYTRRALAAEQRVADL